MNRRSFKFGRFSPIHIPQAEIKLPPLYTGEPSNHEALGMLSYTPDYPTPSVVEKCQMILANIAYPENYNSFILIFDTSEGTMFLRFHGEANITLTHTEYKAILPFKTVSVGQDIKIKSCFIIGNGFTVQNVPVPFAICKGKELSINYTFTGGE